MPIKDILGKWNMVTKAITGTAATIIVVIAIVSWFEPAAHATAEHSAIRAEVGELFAASGDESYTKGLQAELERVDLAIKVLNGTKERRVLTEDEIADLEYLKARRLQIRERLYGK